MMIEPKDIKQTPKGFRVEKKIAGQPRLRKTFATYEEAEHVLAKYLNGELNSDAATNQAVNSKKTVTWRQLYDLAMFHKWSNNKSTASQDAAVRCVEEYLSWDGDVRAFDNEAAQNLVTRLEADKAKKGTVNSYTSAIRTMLKVGSMVDVVTWKLPVIKHNVVKGNQRINYFERAEEDQIIRAMHQMQYPEAADLFIVLVETGMRTSEGAYLEWRNVDLEQRIIRVWGDSTKTGESRVVPITQRCFGALKRRLAAREGLIQRVWPMATKSWRRKVWDHLRVVFNNYDKDWVWYTTRHTAASRMMRFGVDVKTIQTVLGHAKIETTMRYIQFSRAHVMGAAAILDEAHAKYERQKIAEIQVGTVDTGLAPVAEYTTLTGRTSL